VTTTDEFRYKEDSPHDAGYDAFMTGVVFLRAMHHKKASVSSIPLSERSPSVHAAKRARSMDSEPAVSSNSAGDTRRVRPRTVPDPTTDLAVTSTETTDLLPGLNGSTASVNIFRFLSTEVDEKTSVLASCLNRLYLMNSGTHICLGKVGFLHSCFT